MIKQKTIWPTTRGAWPIDTRQYDTQLTEFIYIGIMMII